MIRLVTILISMIVVLAGCGGSVLTRSEAQMKASISGEKSYSFALKPEQENAAYSTARNLVAEELAVRGFVNNQASPILLQITLSDRLASIAITAGEQTNEADISAAKKMKLLQSCKDREHRLSIMLVNQTNGAEIYVGSAAEYHCKGRIEDSLPHLVKAAMSEFGGSLSGIPVRAENNRAGVE